MSEVTALRSTVLGDVPHGFLTRLGGVSTGEVAGLNTGLGSGDDPALVMENRRRAAEAVLPGAKLVAAYQIHSPTCVIVDEPWDHDHRPEADALATNKRGVLLSIVTADCAPILLCDADAGVIGAAHAGWRGAVEGVTCNTIAAMEQLGAERTRIQAAIGPCIARANYEVGHDFRDGFVTRDPETDRFFVDGPAGKPHFDLEAFVASRLAAAGIGRIEAMGRDTYSDEQHFYSYRRSTHRNEPTYGRQISMIGLGD